MDKNNEDAVKKPNFIDYLRLNMGAVVVILALLALVLYAEFYKPVEKDPYAGYTVVSESIHIDDMYTREESYATEMGVRQQTVYCVQFEITSSPFEIEQSITRDDWLAIRVYDELIATYHVDKDSKLVGPIQFTVTDKLREVLRDKEK